LSLKRPLRQAIAFGLAAAAAAWAFSRWEGAWRLLLLLAIVVTFVAWSTPRLGVALLDRALDRLRAFHWRHEEGRHHAFGGVPLRVEDDGHQPWIGGDGLRRVTGRTDGDEVLTARHAGRWRRAADGELLLRADAVIDVLSHGPDRHSPRTLRLCRYLEREVVFPAAERRRRRQQAS
jgi:hypothetical protein